MYSCGISITLRMSECFYKKKHTIIVKLFNDSAKFVMRSCDLNFPEIENMVECIQ